MTVAICHCRSLACLTCGSHEIVSRLNGSLRCAWLFSHGAPLRPRVYCATSPCQKLHGHSGKHRGVVVIRQERLRSWA